MSGGAHGGGDAAEFVFLHSSFRTSSTWLWDLFRRRPDTRAYCEVFHEILGHLKAGDVDVHNGAGWRSKHVETAPYFREFVPVLRPEGGARLYRDGMAFDRYVPADGIRGDPDDEETAYLADLIGRAGDEGRLPVLSCTRSLGRMHGIRRRLGGRHLFLYRNLYQQWMSYAALGYHRNPYFLNTAYYTIDRNRRDPFLARLCGLPLRGMEPGVGLGSGCLEADEDAFVMFAGLHLYLSMNALGAADLVIDANRLAADEAYRRVTEEGLERLTGCALDLSSVREGVEFAPFFVADRHALTDRLNHVLDDAVAALALEGEEAAEAARFGRRMLDDALAAMDRHQFDIAALKPVLAEHAAEVAQAQEAIRALQARLDAVEALAAGQSVTITRTRIEADEAIRALTAERDAARGHAENLGQALAAAGADAEHQRAARQSLETSTCWTATAPLRWAMNRARRLRGAG